MLDRDWVLAGPALTRSARRLDLVPEKCEVCASGRDGGSLAGLRSVAVRMVGARPYSEFIWYVCEACETPWTSIREGGMGARSFRLEEGQLRAPRRPQP